MDAPNQRGINMGQEALTLKNEDAKAMCSGF